MSSWRKQFSIRKKIAEGQFGTVFEVVDTKSGKVFALKEILINSKNQPMVEREIEIQNSINHPAILRILDFHVEKCHAYLLTELNKYSLSHLISNSVYPLSPKLKKLICIRVLKGLHELHSNGILHRDIKPGNILLNSKFQALICDFGSAIRESQKIDGSFPIEGFTLWYKSPELLMGKRDYGYEIDIWSFGCVFAELLLGMPIFASASEIHLLGKIASILGSPEPENWPKIVEMPNYGKLDFIKTPPKDLRKVIPETSSEELRFLSRMLCYGDRPTAIELLNDPYLLVEEEEEDLSKFTNLLDSEQLERSYYSIFLDDFK